MGRKVTSGTSLANYLMVFDEENNKMKYVVEVDVDDGSCWCYCTTRVANKVRLVVPSYSLRPVFEFTTYGHLAICMNAPEYLKEEAMGLGISLQAPSNVSRLVPCPMYVEPF